MTGRKPWNHNIAYFPFIEAIARERPRWSAIDVGTGDGMLAARLSAFIPSVVGLDRNQDQVDAASTESQGRSGLHFAVGDVLTALVPDEPFDFVTASAVVHHLELEPALRRLRELTAPGGTLVIVGLGADRSPLDFLIAALSLVPVRIGRARHGWHEHGAPKMDPQDSWGDIRRATKAALPGSRFRRRLYWRYSVVWNNAG